MQSKPIECGTDVTDKMQTFELMGGGILLYDETLLSPDSTDRYFAELRG